MSAAADNEWIVTSTNSDNNELMKPERIYIYHKEHVDFDLNEYDKLKNFDLKTKTVIVSKSTEELNQDNLILARNSLDKNFIYINSIKNENKTNTSTLKVQDDIKLKKSFSSPALDVNKRLSADTIRVLSDIEINKLSFDLLFNDISTLKASAVLGLLGKTNFRCLAWMIFLECIPTDKTKWIDSINHNRNVFEKIKKEICCDPHDDSYILDKFKNEREFDHPLSQDDTSLWNKYFKNNELKSVINQDVVRIHQHNDYLGHESTQNKLVNLLFIYAEFTNTEYRQGMHEIYATILYTLHDEYTKLSKSNDSNGMLKKLADLNYLEHDSFTIFQAIMNTVHEWFGTSQSARSYLKADQNTRRVSRRLSCSIQNGKIVPDMNPRLFYEETNFYETPIINKINHITKILEFNDIEISNHLNQVDVSLQPFGIRWMRLLFLRELEFPTLLIIWDAIFATDSHEFSLADYIFVAMLTCLRDDILRGDNSFCMRLLMQPHLELDPSDVLKAALYLYDSATYERPDIMETSYDVINPLTPTKNSKHLGYPMSSPPSLSNVSSASSKSSYNDSNNNLLGVSKQQYHQQQQIHTSNSKKHNNNNNNNHNQHNRKELDINKIANKLDYPKSNFYYESNEKRNLHRRDYEMNVIKMQGYGHNVDYVNYIYINKITELQYENQKLKNRLNELEDICNMCSMKMNANISLLQEEIVKLNGRNPSEDDPDKEDLMLLAIAGLKKVRDQLNPNFCNGNSDYLIDSSSNEKDHSKINYRNNQEHKTIQTSFEYLANELDLKSATLKQKFSTFLKKNMSKVNELNSEQTKNNIKGRMRSFSLKTTSLNFPPTSVLGQLVTKTSSNNNLPQNISSPSNHSDVYSNLEDTFDSALSFNQTKLVFTQSTNNNSIYNQVESNNNDLLIISQEEEASRFVGQNDSQF